MTTSARWARGEQHPPSTRARPTGRRGKGRGESSPAATPCTGADAAVSVASSLVQSLAVFSASCLAMKNQIDLRFGRGPEPLVGWR
jgi:hypothetical protein